MPKFAYPTTKQFDEIKSLYEKGIAKGLVFQGQWFDFSFYQTAFGSAFGFRGCSCGSMERISLNRTFKRSGLGVCKCTQNLGILLGDYLGDPEINIRFQLQCTYASRLSALVQWRPFLLGAGFDVDTEIHITTRNYLYGNDGLGLIFNPTLSEEIGSAKSKIRRDLKANDIPCIAKQQRSNGATKRAKHRSSITGINPSKVLEMFKESDWLSGEKLRSKVLELTGKDVGELPEYNPYFMKNSYKEPAFSRSNVIDYSQCSNRNLSKVLGVSKANKPTGPTLRITIVGKVPQRAENQVQSKFVVNTEKVELLPPVAKQMSCKYAGVELPGQSMSAGPRSARSHRSARLSEIKKGIYRITDKDGDTYEIDPLDWLDEEVNFVDRHLVLIKKGTIESIGKQYRVKPLDLVCSLLVGHPVQATDHRRKKKQANVYLASDTSVIIAKEDIGNCENPSLTAMDADQYEYYDIATKQLNDYMMVSSKSHSVTT